MVANFDERLLIVRGSRDPLGLRLNSGASSRRGAFTLTEVLLVLAVLVALAAIAWPSVVRSVENARIQNAAEVVRNELADTRGRAVDTGLIYQFLYEPGGRRYVSIPFERETTPSDNQRMAITASATIDDLPRNAGELPNGLVFPKESLIDFSLQKLDMELFSGLPDADSLASIRWAEPILFHTDGSAEGPDIDVADTHKSTLVTLSVRDLTGAVNVSAVTREGTP